MIRVAILSALLGALLCTAGLAACSGPAPAPREPVPAWVRQPLDEPALMARLRVLVETDPASAVGLAYLGERCYPDSRWSEERGMLAIRALVRLQWVGPARARAEEYLARYPEGSYATSVMAMTGAEPPPRAATDASADQDRGPDGEARAE